MLNVADIRKDFPILSSQIYGKPLVYLDNGATTQKPQCVIDALISGYTHHNANVHRGVHFLSQEATDLHESARIRVQHFINARESAEIIFTRGTTESINLVASSFGEAFLHEGDEVIVTDMEHHSNIVSWQLIQARKHIVIRHVRLDDFQQLDVDHLKSLFTPCTKLLSLTHVSNVLGTINPVKDIISFAHSKGVPVLIDGAQSTPHLKIDVQSLDCDFLVFSAHKIYGPTGLGVLYGKREWLEQMPPYQGGGEMIQSVSFEGTTFNVLPYKFEAGTPDYISTVAFAKALDYVEAIGLENIAEYEHTLLTYCTDELMRIPGMRIFGNAKDKSAVMSFLVGNIHHYDMGMLLDKLGIAVRTGHHCAEPLMRSLGIQGTVRASFSFYNTVEEIDALVAGVKRVAKMFGE